VEVATTNAGLTSLPFVAVMIENLAYGEVVPIPTLPFDVISKKLAPLDEATENIFKLVSTVEIWKVVEPTALLTTNALPFVKVLRLNLAKGDVVPIPTLPLEFMTKSVLVAVPAVEDPIAKSVEAACEA
jgi:hypothetical protein